MWETGRMTNDDVAARVQAFEAVVRGHVRQSIADDPGFSAEEATAFDRLLDAHVEQVGRRAEAEAGRRRTLQRKRGQWGAALSEVMTHAADGDVEWHEPS